MRQYAHTQGRVRSDGVNYALETLVVVTVRGREVAARLAQTQRMLLEVVNTPVSLAEVAARIGVHLGVARVLVGDLDATGLVAISAPTGSELPDVKTLEQLLADLNSL